MVGVLEERERSAGDQRARRLVAGDEEREQEDQELVAVERPAVDLGADEERHDVVAGIRLLRRDVLHEIHEQLAGRLRGRFGRLVGRLDGRVGPAPEVGPVAVGDAEQLGDHHQRERRGDEVDEVERAGIRRAIEHGARELANARLEVARSRAA